MSEHSFWFIAGSQQLYGGDALQQVEADSRKIVENLNRAKMPYPIVFKTVAASPETIEAVCSEANYDNSCIGVITWMHTFSPSKMWIAGLVSLNKPLLHLHTQFNRDIPWDTIDMDFMCLNQSAHGDREHGFIGARLRLPRKVIAGYWTDAAVQKRVAGWMRAASGAMAGRRLKVIRFGDNMREVAVTEGDKVEAQIKFGWSVNGYGVGYLADEVSKVSVSEARELVREYESAYELRTDNIEGVQEQAKYEIALTRILERGGWGAFTTNFEDLHGLRQLPGLAVQRLMGSGFGFGPEGDWKTAALLRVVKLMTKDLGGGASIMEDFTYHLEPGREAVLGAHMLEICPSIADGRPRLEIHPLAIGGGEDPARLVFNAKPGPALCLSLIDMGGRMRLIAAEVEALAPYHDMPMLPVARAVWRPLPDFNTGAESWIYAGGSHHTVFTYDLTIETVSDLAQIAGIEFVHIGKGTTVEALRQQLAVNDAVYRLR